MKYIKKEFIKLTSMILLLSGLFLVIDKSLLGWLSLVGTFLCLEHIYSYGRNDFFDFLGHEWFGLILFLIGSLHNFMASLLFVVGWLLMTDFTYFNPIDYMKLKLNYILQNENNG